MRPVSPIFTADLFPGLHRELIQLLRGLGEADWSRPTAARSWCVKDIAAHLLDGDLRRLSFQRDGLSAEPDEPIASYADLVSYLNRLNADWVKATRRISPRLLVDLLEITGAQISDLFQSCDPFAPALFPVAWAGDEASPLWFDIAREYTERWHHQQQIRDAVGASALTAREWLHPVLDTFFRALPHTYRDTEAEDGARIAVKVTGEAGGTWTLQREDGAWQLYEGEGPDGRCRIRMDQDTAWRRATKGLSEEETARRVEISGERELGTPIFRMLAVMG